MIREDLADNAANALAQVLRRKRDDLSVARHPQGGTSTSIKGFPGAAPQWIRLVRSGNTFTGYYSANGTAWTTDRQQHGRDARRRFTSAWR